MFEAEEEGAGIFKVLSRIVQLDSRNLKHQQSWIDIQLKFSFAQAANAVAGVLLQQIGFCGSSELARGRGL